MAEVSCGLLVVVVCLVSEGGKAEFSVSPPFILSHDVITSDLAVSPDPVSGLAAIFRVLRANLT